MMIVALLALIWATASVWALWNFWRIDRDATGRPCACGLYELDGLDEAMWTPALLHTEHLCCPHRERV